MDYNNQNMNNNNQPFGGNNVPPMNNNPYDNQGYNNPPQGSYPPQNYGQPPMGYNDPYGQPPMNNGFGQQYPPYGQPPMGYNDPYGQPQGGYPPQQGYPPQNYGQPQGGYPPNNQPNGNYSAPEKSPLLAQQKGVFLAADPESNKKTFAKAAIVLILGAIALFFVLGLRFTTCTEELSAGGITMKTTYKITSIFNNVTKVKLTLSFDYSKYQGDHSEAIKTLKEQGSEACKDYKTGCSVSVKATDDTISYTLSLSGKALEAVSGLSADLKDFNRDEVIKQSRGKCK